MDFIEVNFLLIFGRYFQEEIFDLWTTMGVWQNKKKRRKSSAMVRETGIQYQVESYQRLKDGTWYRIA